VRIIRFGGLGRQLYDVSTAGVNYADTHQDLSPKMDQRHSVKTPEDPGPVRAAGVHVSGHG
jgi:hypothetical protein